MQQSVVWQECTYLYVGELVVCGWSTNVPVRIQTVKYTRKVFTLSTTTILEHMVIHTIHLIRQ